MARPVTLCTLQWGDLPLDVICEKAKSFGFDGVELGLPSHLDVRQTDPEYYRNIKVTLDKYGLQLFCISNHLIGQAICDNIDQRHKSVLPDYIWGDGDPEGVHPGNRRRYRGSSSGWYPWWIPCTRCTCKCMGWFLP